MIIFVKKIIRYLTTSSIEFLTNRYDLDTNSVALYLSPDLMYLLRRANLPSTAALLLGPVSLPEEQLYKGLNGMIVLSKRLTHSDEKRSFG